WRPAPWRGSRTGRAPPTGDRRVVAASSADHPSMAWFLEQLFGPLVVYVGRAQAGRKSLFFNTRSFEEKDMARKYSKSASKDVESAMHRKKKGTLKSGKSGKKVKSRKQAIAIGLSEARKKGAKVPAPKKKKSAKKAASKKKSASKKSASKKTAHKKSSSRKKTGSKKKSSK